MARVLAYRPRQKLLLAGSALLIAAAAETAVADGAIASAVAAATRAADWIAQRSPGERWGEHLTKGPKPELNRVARALSKVREMKPPLEKAAAAEHPPFGPAGALPEDTLLLPAGAPAFALGPIAGGSPEGPVYFFPGFPGAPIPTGPIAGGGGGGGGGGGTTPETPPAAVPEPGLWLTLILGFGAAGGALRRKRSPGRAYAG